MSRLALSLFAFTMKRATGSRAERANLLPTRQSGTSDLRLPSPASLNQSQRTHSRLVHDTGRIQSIVLLVSG